MRQITRDIVRAFNRGLTLKIDNSRTDGTSLWLFDNKIAEFRNDELWISNAGWTSATTKERLNGLSGVNIVQRRGTWFLNGREWDGRWVNVDAWNDGIEYVDGASVPASSEPEPEFDLSSVWVDEEGYSRPIYAVWHSNNPSDLLAIEGVLRNMRIPSRRWESDTEGVYRPNYFVVVRPEDFNRVITNNQ